MPLLRPTQLHIIEAGLSENEVKKKTKQPAAAFTREKMVKAEHVPRSCGYLPHHLWLSGDMLRTASHILKNTNEQASGLLSFSFFFFSRKGGPG